MMDAPATAEPLAISLSGEFDVYNAEQFAQLLSPAYDKRYIILDFNAVRRLDCTTFTNLLRMRRRRSQQNMPVERFVGLNAQLRKIFRMTHLDQVWPMYETLDEAMQSFFEARASR